LGAKSSFVTPQNPLTDRIDGGARRGANLFHSFLEFNVDEGRGVYFSNPSGIENILSRVTGDKSSQIFGRLGVLGDANLFLLNPKGILFGPNANIEIKGSFLATTANAIKLGEQGYFSAAEPQNSQLLSVTPGVLFFNAVANQSAAITNRGNLATGQNLTLAAGNLNLEGQLHAGKNLTLQAVETVRIRDNITSPFIASAGDQLLIQGNQGVDIFALNNPESGFFSGGDMIAINSGGSITFNGLIDASANLNLASGTYLGNGGDVTLLANGDITLAPGSGIRSVGLLGGNITLKSNGAISATGGIITSGSTTNGPGTTGGDINVIASSLSVTNGAQLGAGTVGSGNGGNLNITTRSLSVTNGAQLIAATSGKGNAGNVRIQASDSITLDGVGSNGNSSGAIVGSLGEGDAGEIKITTRSLSVINGAQLGAASSGKGNAGNVRIQASDSITLDGVGSNGNSSGAIVGSLGEGDAGEINITTRSLSLTNGAQLGAATLGKGNAGNVTIQASDSISFDGVGSNGNSSGAIVGSLGEGDAGEINITTRSLSLTNGAQLLAATFLGKGNAGDVNLQASDSITFDGVGSNGDASGAIVASFGEGNAGEINITTRSLSVMNGAQLAAATLGKGNAGSVTIQASNSITFDGVGSNGDASGAIVASFGEGNAGEINITTRSLSVMNGAQLAAATLGKGNAGNVTIQASDSITFDGVGSDGTSSGAGVGSEAEGNGGDIKITTRSLSVTNGAQLGAGTLGKGDAGSVTIQASDSITFDGVGSNGDASGAFSNVEEEAQGNAGEINITTRSLFVTNGAQLEAATSGQGNAGSVKIQASDSITFDGVGSNGDASGAFSNVEEEAQGNAGDIKINTRSLLVTNGAQLLAGTTGEGKAGSVTIQATDSVSVRNDSAVGASSEGAGQPGDVTIKTGRLNVTDRSRVSVSNLGSATGGELDITAGSILLNNQGQLTAETNSGEGGNIRLQVQDLLLMRRNSSISTEARGAGNSGNININTQFLVAIPSENSDIIASAVKGGNIEITAQGIFGIQFRESLTPESEITATGTVTLDTPDVDIQSSLNQLNANFVNPDQAIASSCLARRNAIAGSFTVTGTGGLPATPYETLSSQYPVTSVQGLPTEARQQASSPIPNSPYPIANHWKLGDPVQEAQGIMVTADGRIIAGTAPQLVAAAKAQELVCN
jgi:filamentous hemagglutinin family protein